MMRFHIRPVLTLFSIVGLSMLIGLGNWQLHRLEWKRELIAKVETRVGAEPMALDDALSEIAAGRDLDYAPVRAEGVFLHDKEAHLFGTFSGAPGYYVFTPLKRGDGSIVYVNRGFAPQQFKDIETRADGQAAGVMTVTGLLRSPEAPKGLAAFFQPANAPARNQWYRRDPAAFAEQAGLEAAPVYIDAFAVDGVDWPKGGVTRLNFSNRHLEYALTWFALGACLVGVWLAFSLGAGRSGAQRRDQ